MVGVKLSKLFALALIAFSPAAKANVFFEGYFRIYSKKEPIGYAIRKYEFDEKKKKFIATTFTKISTAGGESSESLKATANENLKPISYTYTSLAGKETSLIDAKFDGNKMTAVANINGKTKSIRNTLPKDTILSALLTYSMLKREQGIAPKVKFEYAGIAEELGQVIPNGSAQVVSEETYAGLKAFKIKNDFAGHFTAYITPQGEVLATSDDEKPISAELMADPAKATAGFTVNKTVLKALFGDVPEGKNNTLAKSATMSPVSPGKLEGVPQGQGIQIKGEPEKK